MAEGAQGDDDAYGRATDPALDAAEHLAAAIGTEAWPQAREQVVGLLSGEDGSTEEEDSTGERVEAWAAEALRRQREDEDPNAYLIDSLPEWRREIAAVLADDPERAEAARRFSETVRSLLPRPDDTATQVAVATGHGTVNAVQNGNIYYQVVLGLAPRPRRLSRGTAITAAAAGATGAAVGGDAVVRHFAAEAVDKAGVGHLPQAPLANPAVAPNTAAPTGGAMTPGTTAAAKTGSAILGKAASAVSGKFAGVFGVGAGGVGVPAVAAVVSVVVVVVATVTVVVMRTSDHGSCDAAVHGQSSRDVLAEAARRVELTSFRFDVTRGPNHVRGAADPQSRNAWFTQGLTDGPVVIGTIAQGKVVLPVGATTPTGADPRWVRSDGAFTDAVDPAASARQLRSVTTARRKGCEFTGTLLPSTAPVAAGSAGPMAAPLAARTRTGPTAPSPGTTGASPSRSADGSDVPFTARIDDKGRLVWLKTEAPADGLPLSARYSDFGLTVTPSVPPSATAHRSPSPGATHTLTGDWAGVWATDFATGDFTAKLAQNGNHMTGQLTVSGTGCDLDGPISGTVDGDRITFGTVKSTGKITFTGSMNGAGMHGTFSTDCSNATGDWNARRSPTQR
jgi:hypothetical protein